MPSLTRGPLPARVYWRRRMLLMGLAVLLVVGIARLLGSGSDASSEPEARPAAAAVSSTPSTTPPATPLTTGPALSLPGLQENGESSAPAEPEGPCKATDIVVTPEVRDAVAGPGDGVRVRLGLQTRQSAACTWHVSSQTLTVKITSGHDDIWSSQQCPRLVPDQQVVVRRDEPTTVDLTWNGRRSDDGCPRLTDWALPGFYHVNASALAGEPSDEQFELQAPSAPVITRTPEPHHTKKHGGTSEASPTGSPSAD